MRKASESSADLVYALFLSFIFVIIDYVVITLLTEPLHRFLPIENAVLNNIVHMLIMSVIGTGLGCLAFLAFREKKKLVPLAYSFFPVYVLICLLFVIFNVETGKRSLAFRLISTYTIIPTIVGMTLSWTIYHRLNKNSH